MMIVEFRVPGDPQGKGRPRHSAKTGAVYTPSKTKRYEKVVADLAKLAMGEQLPIEGPVMLQLTALFPIPQSWSKRKKVQAAKGELFPTVKPDFDNVAKAISDAMNKIVFNDDSQVVYSVISKVYAERPGVKVIVSKIN
jgi:Holliday junction resolvase RusA-like endonuclease